MRFTGDRRLGRHVPWGPWGFVLLWWLTGCAAQPGLLGKPWAVARPLAGVHFPVAAGSGHQAVEFELEALTPQRAEQLRHSGTQVPRVFSERTADPRTHRDFIDRRVTAVGFGLTAGGYVLYCEGLELPVLVPESHVDLGVTGAQALNDSIYPDRDAALADLATVGSGSEPSRYAYYRGAGGALIVPTVFSAATTPRIARTMLEVRGQVLRTVEHDLKVLLVSLAGTRVLQGVFSRVMRVGPEPVLRPSAREAESIPEPAAPSPSPAAPATPAPVPGSPAPSPGLVQALTGNNPTRPLAAGPRLPQDVAVIPKVPRVRPLNRPIGPSPTQNAQLQADIQYLEDMGAENIRVNQQQVTVQDVQRVGTNRPDLQFDYDNRRYQVEYDTPTSGRGPGHQSRITSNDPDAETILLIVR